MCDIIPEQPDPFQPQKCRLRPLPEDSVQKEAKGNWRRKRKLLIKNKHNTRSNQ